MTVDVERDVTLVLVDGAELAALRAENARLKVDVQTVLEVASYMTAWCGEPRSPEQDEYYLNLMAHLEARLGEGRLGRHSAVAQSMWNGPEWVGYLERIPLGLRHRGPECEGCGARMDVAGVPWCDRCVADEAADCHSVGS